MKNKKKILQLFVLLILLSPLYLSALDIREEMKERKIPSYLIENTAYISLKGLLKIIEAEDSWGNVEDRVFIGYQGTEIKFQVNSTNVVIGQQVFQLDVPVKEVEGEILVPADSFNNILSGITPASYVSKEPFFKEATETSVKQDKDQNQNFVILIDPGHGGSDAGAIGHYGLKEKEVNFDIARRIREYLKKELRKKTGIKIYMTREGDTDISLVERVQMSKDIKADVFFSVHTNSSRDRRPDADGFETYYSVVKEETAYLPAVSYEEDVDVEENQPSTVSKMLEELNTTSVVDESRILSDFVQERMAERLLTPDRGTKKRSFYVLRYTPMPAVLTEIGFLCNPNVECNLRDAEVRQAIAEALAKGLLDYLEFRDVI